MGMMFRAAALPLLLAVFAVSSAFAGEPVRLLVVVGGHDFEMKPFRDMVDGLGGVQADMAVLKDDSEVFEDISEWGYDCVLLYNMSQRISEKRRENLLALLDRGVGLVVMHHAIAAFNDWPEYWKIIGARYFLKDVKEGDRAFPQSTYRHDTEFVVRPEDPNHPVTAGLKPFTITDETYKGFLTEPDNHLLLTTNHPDSQREIGWCRTHKNARVCFIQPGHGPDIFSLPEFRQLTEQAVRWAAPGAKPATGDGNTGEPPASVK